MSLSLITASVLSQPLTAGEMAGLSGWQWLLICLAIILVVGWLLTYSATFSAQSPYLESLAQHGGEAQKKEGDSRGKAAPHAGIPGSDDLKRIEGIGPKIESLLKAQGIATFDQLAHSNVQDLKEILLAAGLRVNDPTTWPEQASLAARGDWAGLDALQESLIGGRKA